MYGRIILALLLLVSGVSAAPILETYDLSSNQGDKLPPETFQVIVFLDAAASLSTTFSIEMVDTDGSAHWLRFLGTQNWRDNIASAQFNLNGATPTGRYRIRRVYPDGDPDGLALAVFYKNRDGRVFIARTVNHARYECDNFVGFTPLELSEEGFALYADQITTKEGRKHAHSLLHGAQLLQSGDYNVFW